MCKLQHCPKYISTHWYIYINPVYTWQYMSNFRIQSVTYQLLLSPRFPLQTPVTYWGLQSLLGCLSCCPGDALYPRQTEAAQTSAVGHRFQKPHPRDSTHGHRLENLWVAERNQCYISTLLDKPYFNLTENFSPLSGHEAKIISQIFCTSVEQSDNRY